MRTVPTAARGVAPVPAHCRINTTDTFEFPHLGALSVTDAAELLGVTPFTAFFYGARLRSEADVHAVAATMPELSPEQVEAVEAWCEQVARMPVSTIAEYWGISLATAEMLRETLGGVR